MKRVNEQLHRPYYTFDIDVCAEHDVIELELAFHNDATRSEVVTDVFGASFSVQDVENLIAKLQKALVEIKEEEI